jgi:hypothetical protein
MQFRQKSRLALRPRFLQNLLAKPFVSFPPQAAIPCLTLDTSGFRGNDYR